MRIVIINSLTESINLFYCCGITIGTMILVLIAGNLLLKFNFRQFIAYAISIRFLLIIYCVNY